MQQKEHREHEAERKACEAEREAERKELEAERREREAERQLEYEKLRNQERECAVALECLKFIFEGEIPADSSNAQLEGRQRGLGHSPDLSSMVRLLPRFNEKDPDIFFSIIGESG